MQTPSGLGQGVSVSQSDYRAGLDWFRWTFLALAGATAIFQLLANTMLTVSTLWQNALHFALFGMMCVMVTPLRRARSERGARRLLVIDLVFGALIVAATVFLIGREDAIYDRGVTLVTSEWVAALFLMAAAVELSRRTTGFIIPALIVIGLAYVLGLGNLLSGVLTFPGLSAETVVFRSIFGDDALFGTIARISATYVFMFMLFGAFLLASGAAGFIIDMARAAAGKLVGGPGLVAVFASALTGTISGSAIANTASTGVITIPLMKRSGFPPRFAAAVEAAASTGGQIMPPIMGAGAFVMASYTQIPYTTIVAVSVLPAILYFATVAFFVRTEAQKHGIGVADEEAPRPLEILKRGGITFIVPIAVLITLLVQGFTPTYAAALSIVSVVVTSWFTRNPMGPIGIANALALGSRNMVTTAVLLCAVGLIVNVIAMTGIGNTFSLMITTWAGNSLLLAILLVALASLVLGMGLPVTAAYIVLGTLSAPALATLITDINLIQILASGDVPANVAPLLQIAVPDAMERIREGMDLTQAGALVNELPREVKTPIKEQLLDPQVMTMGLLSAHLIVFWLSQDSNVTPPVCLAAFTAAGIANTPQMATGVTAWKVAKGIYLVPLLIGYTALVSGDLYAQLNVFGFALFGLYALTCALQGFMVRHLGWGLRLALLAIGAVLLWPATLVIHAAGLLALILLWSILFVRRRPAG